MDSSLPEGSQEMYWDTPSMFAVRFRWVSMTPFGSPVVPDVNMISARSCGPMSTFSGSGKPAMAPSSSLERYLRDAQVHLRLWSEPRREGQLRLRSGYDPCDVVGRAAKVEGDEDDSRPQTAEEEEHPVGGVRPPEDDLVPLRQSPALEEGCNLAGLVPQPGVGPAAGTGTPA